MKTLGKMPRRQRVSRAILGAAALAVVCAALVAYASLGRTAPRAAAKARDAEAVAVAAAPPPQEAPAPDEPNNAPTCDVQLD